MKYVTFSYTPLGKSWSHGPANNKRLRCAGMSMPRAERELDEIGRIYNNIYHS